MIDYCRACLLTSPVHELYRFRRQAGLQKNLYQQGSSMGNVFSGLEHARVPAEERRKHFPGGNRQRKIERTNQAGHADRPAEAHRPFVTQLARRGMSEEPPPLARGVVRGVDPLLNISARLGERLAHLARHSVGDLLLSASENVANPSEYISSRGGRLRPPHGEPAPRTFDCAANIAGAGERELPNQVRLVRRITVLEPGA